MTFKYLLRVKRAARPTTWLLAIAASLIFIASLPVSAEDKYAVTPEQNEQYYWMLFVDSRTLPKYMAYPGSTLNPVDSFVVTYRKTSAEYILRGLTAPDFAPVKFEDFWYHNGAAIGLKRFSDLQLPANLQGAIAFRSTDLSLGHPRSAANCAIRLLLEAHLQKCIVSAILVPDANFEQVAGDLNAFNFVRVQAGVTGTQKGISTRLQSYPGGQEASFYYGETGSK